MPEINITQSEANGLITMPKVRFDDQQYVYPGTGGAISVPLISQDKRENFLLDVSRGRINLLKGKYQTRARQVVVLVRLDFGGPPHRNPDDEEIACPHLHIYREGFADKWAMPAPTSAFPNTNDLWQTLTDFMQYCNIVEPPLLERGLFV
jgi:hypothetical protein